MNQPAIEACGEGRYRISGPMVFDTAAGLLALSRVAFGEAARHGPVELDLAGVSNADSAGLALLLEWTSWARAGGSLRFSGMPEKLRAIARLSEVDRLLSAEEAPDLHAAGGS